MKHVILVTILLAAFVAGAQQKVPFDYPELVPTAPMTLLQAKEVLARTELLKDEAKSHYEEIKKEKIARLESWVEYKKSIVEQGRRAIDECKRDPQCVSQANKKLTDEISAVHEKIREINVFYDGKLSDEKKIIERKLLALTKVLVATKNAVIINALQEEAVKANGQDDFILESHFILDTFVDQESTTQYLRQKFKQYTWYWNVNDQVTYTLSSFYFRTSQRQSHLTLIIDTNKVQNYDDVKAQILDSKNQNETTVFGIKRALLFTDMLKVAPGNYIYGSNCLGLVKSENGERPEKACVAALDNDSVSLQ